jgi:hypothetical protein
MLDILSLHQLGKPMESETPKEFTTQYWVCVGYYVAKDHTLGIHWRNIDINKSGGLGNHWHYAASLFKDAFVGQQITIDATIDNTSCRVKTAKHQGVWPISHDRMEWELVSETAKLELRLYRQSRFDKRAMELITVLAPLHQQYVVATPTERRIIEVLVLEFLRNGKLK